MTSTAESTPVILGAARTAFGRFRGALASLPATELGSIAVRAALERSGVSVDDVHALVLGQVIQVGAGQGPARQTAIAAGLAWSTPATTINKICLSGLTTVIDAARLVRAGEADVVVAGGQESMSNAPHALLGSRRGLGYGDVPLFDTLGDGLTDPFSGRSMGALTEDGNGRLGLDRQAQDAFAARSHARAAAARTGLGAEIVPVLVEGRAAAGQVTVDDDEGVRPDSTVESLGRLRAAFAPDGTITAGNASPLSDGAAAVVVASEGYARRHGLTWMARIGAHGQVAGPDTSLHRQASRAIRAALDREGGSVGDLDVIEINEAFAAVALASAADLGIDPEQLNGEGGAIAIGHPIGASGSRLAVHAAHVLARRGRGTAALGICGGGGQGEALLLHAP
ncbi:acetyl-CoA C-acyltransferase [Cellulomonas fimi]|uniref:Probable acetyl-CoA acetyltransferase n=1 Tax=Cellulomonas fimi (strain ATCC 484 / DSM 20113 / JCM 1341 / CCUG 24087 / LMG 16345 / NBRC 15513 / NCIMB 8980 / NCTC 7547 / NRS-133) TaxID=590998 RepID=F4GYK3_CELFA|nr:acetyl-CoA C-acyltransferase [Cellulomonas fimi]AEE47120.1 acetyl-CoA acetyltransferase [Cellulomonas fimi ATCC 484]NNH05612.1 acetyl-CoA C-acyltransferase [Cellulomonas fimi]VEH35312.1 Probable acetyl-CoA acetyltransferase [Cellulomonas fimi]